ncbi:MAG: endonuclease V [Desulfobacteraceae bacterium]|nr:endonuclease V [Desulfobacteraceae bacterium]
MIVAIDVDYENTVAHAAAVGFETWASDTQILTRTWQSDVINDYQPGRFYRRELGPIMGLLGTFDVNPDIIVIDAYCHLSQSGEPGLGMHLYVSMDHRFPVIGVAKNRFRGTTHALEILRGNSKKPLFVTAAGISLDEAGQYIASMHGDHRIPTMIKLADSLSRNWLK